MKLVVGQVVEESPALIMCKKATPFKEGGQRQTAEAGLSSLTSMALVTPLGSPTDLRNFPKRFLGWQWTAKKFLYYSDVSATVEVILATKWKPFYCANKLESLQKSSLEMLLKGNANLVRNLMHQLCNLLLQRGESRKVEWKCVGSYNKEG